MVAENTSCTCVTKVGHKTFITIDGETRRLHEWAEEYGISWQCIIGRVRSGWDWELAIVTPTRAYRRRNSLGIEEVVRENKIQSQWRGASKLPGASPPVS
jgi:hypothetical protein